MKINEKMKRQNIKTVNAETLGTVHTHTHTHTLVVLDDEKAEKVNLINCQKDKLCIEKA